MTGSQRTRVATAGASSDQLTGRSTQRQVAPAPYEGVTSVTSVGPDELPLTLELLYPALIQRERRTRLKADFESADWRKSTFSGGGNCVEVASVDGRIAVRDSKDRLGPILTFSSAEWEAFIKGIMNGQFNLR